MPSDKYTYWDAIEKAFDAVETDQPRQFLADIKKYPSWIVDLLAVHWTVREVQNGGLTQYFYNSTDVLAAEAVEGFKKIGFLEFSNLLAQAMAYFSHDYPREREARIKLLAGPGEEPDDDWYPKPIDQFESADDLLIETADRIYDAMDVCARAHRPKRKPAKGGLVFIPKQMLHCN